MTSSHRDDTRLRVLGALALLRTYGPARSRIISSLAATSESETSDAVGALLSANLVERIDDRDAYRVTQRGMNAALQSLQHRQLQS